jgi:hypothetical protein
MGGWRRTAVERDLLLGYGGGPAVTDLFEGPKKFKIALQVLFGLAVTGVCR